MSICINPSTHTLDDNLSNEVRNLRANVKLRDDHIKQIRIQLDECIKFISSKGLADEFMAYKVAQRMEDK